MTSFFSYVYFQKGKHNQKMRLLIDLWRQIHRPLDSWRSWSNQKTFMLALWCQSVFSLVIIANLPNYYHLLFLKCIRSLFWNGINYQLISQTHVSRNATVKDVAQSRTYLGQGICNSYFDKWVSGSSQAREGGLPQFLSDRLTIYPPGGGGRLCPP